MLLFHDGEHGSELIDALARHGDGLPANVLPVQVNEVTQIGLEAVAGGLRLWRLRRALAHPRQAAPRSRRPRADRRAGRADPCRPRLCRRARRHHRDRRSGRAGTSVARHSRHGRRGQARNLRRRRPQARRGAPCFARIARRRPRPGRYRAAAARRAVRQHRGQGRRLHAVPVLRAGLPDRRAVGRSGTADAALCRGRLRAMRAVPGRPARRK